MKIKNINDLVKEIAKRKGKKKKVDIAQIKEIFRVLVDIQVNWYEYDATKIPAPIGLLYALAFKKAVKKLNLKKQLKKLKKT